MKKDIIEVFVEKNCAPCKEVLFILTQISSIYKFELRVHEREHDKQIFYERRIFICPATFLNGQLVFYGTFMVEALTNKLTSITH